MVGCVSTDMDAHAASFDCAKAGTKVEHMVCDDPELTKLDEEMANAYKVALQDKAKAEQIKQAQRKWLKVRDDCVDVECVKSAYETRLVSLVVTHSATNNSVPPAQAKVKAPISTQAKAACVAPKIDWRNYEWTLITGNGEAICEEMLAYVKSRPNDIAPPTCPDERLPKNSDWTRPESRILSEAEKQALLRDIPEKFQQGKPGGPVSYEQQIKNSGLLRVIRADITRDGVPESLLAFNSPRDPQQTCERSKRCAPPEAVFKGGVVLFSDSYYLLPMNDAGTEVNWSHRTVRATPMLMGGELIYYKELPYWMTNISWSQNLADNFEHYRTRPDDPYSAIFGLNGLGHSVIGQYGGEVKPAPFREVKHIRGDGSSCRFGYFHRDNLKQNPHKVRR